MEKKKLPTHKKWILTGLKLYSLGAFIALVFIIVFIGSYLHAVTNGWNFTIERVVIQRSTNKASDMNIYYHNPNRFTLYVSILQMEILSQNGTVLWTNSDGLNLQVPSELHSSYQVTVLDSSIPSLYNISSQGMYCHFSGRSIGTTCMSTFNFTVVLTVIGGI